MTRVRKIACGILLLSLAAALFARWISPAPYDRQFREAANAEPSAQFPLGTDDLGRDRLSRLLAGAQVSLLLAPAASLLAILLAAMIGGLAGYLGGAADRAIMAAVDLFLSLPWLFLLLAVRAMLPLNVSPLVSVTITFALLGLLGWAAAARVVRAGVRELMDSDFVLHARAQGATPARILWRELLPNVRPILMAQFWISIPVFILSEASLGLLGLGVAEPLPSLGNLLRDLEHPGASWVMFIPAVFVVVLMICFQLVLPQHPQQETSL